MDTDRIERDTLIEASVERVWSFVSRAGFWVADDASLPDREAVPGEVMIAKGGHGDFPVRVETVEPSSYLAYRWTSAFPGEELREDNSTLVEFTLTAEGDSTRLRVVESGFAALAGSDELRRRTMQDNTGGWPQVLQAVKARLEDSAA